MTLSSPRPVAFLLPDLSGGGAERSLLRTAGEIAATGHPVDLVLGDTRGPLRAELPAGVDVFDLQVAHMRSAVGRLRRYVRARRPTHLVPTLEHAVVVADLALRHSHVDTVMIPRVANTLSRATVDQGVVGRLVDRQAAHVYRRARTVVAVSRGVADDLVSCQGVDAAAVRVVPNPVVGPDLLARTRGRATHPWFAPGEPPVVVGMGRLSRQKNFALLVDAFAGVVAQTPARLVILGEGELRGALEDQCRERGIAEVVDLAGFLPEPFALLARAHVFVLSSDFEGLPGALIQAIACGATPVATDCHSGPREILADGEFGALVGCGDVAGMQAAITDALRAPRAELGPEVWGRWSTAVAREAWMEVLDLPGDRAVVAASTAGAA